MKRLRSNTPKSKNEKYCNLSVEAHTVIMDIAKNNKIRFLEVIDFIVLENRNIHADIFIPVKNEAKA